eukprot:362649-Chlamydomonas_euryale.AAC.7
MRRGVVGRGWAGAGRHELLETATCCWRTCYRVVNRHLIIWVRTLGGVDVQRKGEIAEEKTATRC